MVALLLSTCMHIHVQKKMPVYLVIYLSLQNSFLYVTDTLEES